MKKFCAILELDHVDDDGAVYGVLEHENLTDAEGRKYPAQITVPILLYERNGKKDTITVGIAFGTKSNLFEGNEFPEAMKNVILEEVQ